MTTSTAEGHGSVPSGVVTFMFTDVENSTELWAADRSAMSASLQIHDQILRTYIEAAAGFVFTTAGDSFAAAFSRSSDAVDCALVIQDALGSASWPGPTLKVRIGLHLGEAEERGSDYFGPVVNLTARLESAGHGGQVLISDQARRAAEVEAEDLGWHSLRNVPEPVHVFQLGSGEFPPLRIVSPSRTNLPTAPSRLIGRGAVLADVRHALGEHHLVTLTATGGTGKTRLALAVGEAELENYRGGVWFVDLTAVADGDLVPATIAAGIRLVLSGGDPAALVVDYLAGLDALLILDNCEHLVDECADFLELFLSRAGTSKVLATTREYFDIDGERAIRLAPLEVEGESSSAVELFVERALAADSTFTLDGNGREAVVQLCRHLDGSPLAIELAAARSNVMSPAELLEGIGERFELLRAGRRRRSKRALEDTLDWSYQLLDDDEQGLFRLLGAFTGTFDLDAIGAVALLDRGMTLDLTDSLIAKSLVVSVRARDGVRFRLLETTAAYAEHLLIQEGDAELAYQRHFEHFFALCKPFDVGHWPSRQALAFSKDRDNIRSAVKWAGSVNRWEEARSLIFGAATVLELQPEDLHALIDDCLAHVGEADPAESVALRSTKVYLEAQYDLVGGRETAVALEQSSDPYIKAIGLFWHSYFELPENPEATLVTSARCMATAFDLPDSVGRSQLLSVAKLATGWAHARMGNNEQALADYTEMQALAAGLAADSNILAEGRGSTGIVHVVLGDYQAALAVADVLDNLGYVSFDGDEIRAAALLGLGDLERARSIIGSHAADAVTGRLSRKANNSLVLLALLAEAEHDAEGAARLLMHVETARSPFVELSLTLANRLGVSDAFDKARKKGADGHYESGLRAIEVLRDELDQPASKS